MKAEHSIQLLCQVLQVSQSGFYDWKARQQTPSARAQENAALGSHIQSIHEKSRRTYGSPRVAAQLRKEGARHGRNRVARLMKELADGRNAAGASKPPTATTTIPLRPTAWPRRPRPPAPIRSGSATSLTSGTATKVRHVCNQQGPLPWGWSLLPAISE